MGKPIRILGISAFYHDSAAALVTDGDIIAAAQEERFTRKKHDHHMPVNAIAYCLEEAGIGPDELDYVVFYDKPLLKFERLLETYLAYGPRGFKLFTMGLPIWLKQKLHLPREMSKGMKNQYKGRYVFVEHHESHAASAFFPSPFEEAAIMTLDGVGEWSTASLGIGRGNRIEIKRELRFPHSLGLLYSAFTYFTGFRVNSGEYKLMGLAPYGEPKYYDLIMDNIVDLKEDGSFRLNMDYFGYCHNDVMTSGKMADLFGGPARKAESDMGQREMDIAASIQKVTEDIMLRWAQYMKELSGLDNLVMAGGVALNCVGNGRVLREGPFKNVWIQPAAGDAGGALGGALFAWYQLLDKPRKATGKDMQKASMLGPEFKDDEIRKFLDERKAVYTHYETEEDMTDRMAELILSENVIGHMNGRMEFGPRALGNRSIIGDARSKEMQSTMNLKIKFRESFRPFAPIVLQEHVHEYFDMRENEESPYMLLVAPVREEKRTKESMDGMTGIEKLKVVRSEVPSITHVDYSARVQTIDKERHPRLHKVISKCHAKSGCPVLINTSFNVRGEPIVCTPGDAYHCFMATHMDVLAVGNFILLKKEQPNWKDYDAKGYLSQFALD